MLDVFVNNGHSIQLDTSIVYKPISDKVHQLQTDIGFDYYTVVVVPLQRSGTRKIVSR